MFRQTFRTITKIWIAPASATNAVIHNKIFESVTRPLDFASRVTTWIISNEEMNDIKKIVTWLEESGLLIKCVSETTKNEAKEQKGGFLSMLLGMLDTSLLGNLITGKGFKTSKISGQGVMREDESTIKAGHNFLCRLIL